jgi:hypothetical protein
MFWKGMVEVLEVRGAKVWDNYCRVTSRVISESAVLISIKGLPVMIDILWGLRFLDKVSESARF